MDPRVVQMPPLSLRADLGPRSISEEDRSVELIFTTTSGVRRRDWMTGKEYVEVLSMEPGHVRLDRLNDGAPLLDSHNSFSVADQLGAVVPGTVSAMKKALPHGGGSRRLQWGVQGLEGLARGASARTASWTAPSLSSALPASASARRWPGCVLSSSS